MNKRVKIKNDKQKTKNKKWRIKNNKNPKSNKFGILKPRYQREQKLNLFILQ